MNRFLLPMCGAALVCGGLVVTTLARADDRSPDAILKELDAAALPVFDAAKRSDQAYIQQYIKDLRDAMARRAGLIGELYRVDPDNAQLVKLLPERWRAMSPSMSGRPDTRELTSELDRVMAQAKNEDLKKEAAFWKAQLACTSAPDDAAKTKAVDEFIALAPMDQRGADLLLMLSFTTRTTPESQKALFRKIVDLYPESSRAESARGTLRRLEAIGKPFELSFTEATSGTEIAMKDLKGKVVVIDFWATWCGPCVAEMPKMKSLYAEYKDKGVEFIGVSLDQKEGGLEKLKEFVHTQGITWPQYFQGDGWNSKFSVSWGINAIPAVFIVDQEGKLYSVEARGKLETLIPELLNRPAPTPKAEGGSGER
jgi:thiol-disulfide isomerase/thioredoxin